MNHGTGTIKTSGTERCQIEKKRVIAHLSEMGITEDCSSEGRPPFSPYGAYSLTGSWGISPEGRIVLITTYKEDLEEILDAFSEVTLAGERVTSEKETLHYVGFQKERRTV